MCTESVGNVGAIVMHIVKVLCHFVHVIYMEDTTARFVDASKNKRSIILPEIPALLGFLQRENENLLRFLET